MCERAHEFYIQLSPVLFDKVTTFTNTYFILRGFMSSTRKQKSNQSLLSLVFKKNLMENLIFKEVGTNCSYFVLPQHFWSSPIADAQILQQGWEFKQKLNLLKKPWSAIFTVWIMQHAKVIRKTKSKIFKFVNIYSDSDNIFKKL